MTFKQWVIELLKDERGGTSIKPVVVLFGTIVLCVTMLMGAWIKDFTPSPNLINAIMIIVSIGMGADTADKFSYRPKYNFENEEEKEKEEEKEEEKEDKDDGTPP